MSKLTSKADESILRVDVFRRACTSKSEMRVSRSSHAARSAYHFQGMRETRWRSSTNEQLRETTIMNNQRLCTAFLSRIDAVRSTRDFFARDRDLHGANKNLHGTEWLTSQSIDKDRGCSMCVSMTATTCSSLRPPRRLVDITVLQISFCTASLEPIQRQR